MLQTQVAKQVLHLTEGCLVVRGFDSRLAIIRLPAPGPIREDILRTLVVVGTTRVTWIFKETEMIIRRFDRLKGCSVTLAVVSQEANPAYDWWLERKQVLELRSLIGSEPSLCGEYVVALVNVAY